MASYDGEIKINTKVETKDLDKQLTDVKGKLDTTSKTIGKSLAAGIGGAAAVAGIKKTVDALNDCAAAYRVQEKAEKALEVAARNNPYLNDQNVSNLKNFASELQKVSDYGDEATIAIMAQLAATGRQESEITAIMQAAADMAAATGQDIASVAQTLNATYSGTTGTLGRQIASIKNLTAEELAAGKAIEIVAAQYKGSAAELAQVEIQLTNSWGDFKENIGRGWQAATQPVKQFFLDTLNSVNEIIGAGTEVQQAAAAEASGNASTNQKKILLDEAKERLQKMRDMQAISAEIRKDSDYYTKLTQQELKEYNEFWAKTSNEEVAQQVAALETRIRQLTIEYGKLSEEERKAAEAAAAAASEADKAAAAAERDKQATEHINANNKALQDKIALMELQASVTGEEIDAQELYNVYLQSYLDLISQSNGLVTENNTAAKARLEIVKELAEEAKAAEEAALKEAEAQKEKEEAAKKAEEAEKERNQQAQAIRESALALLKDEEAERLKLINDIAESEILTEEEKNAAIEKLNKEHYQSLASEVNDYVAQTQAIISDASAIMLQNVENESQAELAAIEEKYTRGLISEQEYNEKKKEIEKKAAQDSYKIKMFEWTASLLAASANIAEGVTKAIAQGGTAGLITGALVGAAGAVQIASIVASKPVPPSFYTGGVIGGMNGATMGGDNTYIHARSGEMVLNAAQQRSLWDMINGQQSRGGYSLTVNNTQAGRVDTQITQDNAGLIVEIFDKHINAGLSTGTYDSGLAAMTSRQQGVTIL